MTSEYPAIYAPRLSLAVELRTVSERLGSYLLESACPDCCRPYYQVIEAHHTRRQRDFRERKLERLALTCSHGASGLDIYT